MYYMSEVSNPVSIRLSEIDKTLLRELGNESVSTGVKKLIHLYREGSLSAPGPDQEEQFRVIEEEIKNLKSSPFGFDKKEIMALEKGLEKAKEEFKKSKTESIKERLKLLVNSAG
jgi:hypothetical protein